MSYTNSNTIIRGRIKVGTDYLLQAGGVWSHAMPGHVYFIGCYKL